MKNKFDEFDGEARILDLAMTFSEMAGHEIPSANAYARALFRAAKSENAGRDEALFMLASFLAYRTKTNDDKTHRMAVDVIDSIFDSNACEFMNYDEFIDLAALVGERVQAVDFNEVLNLFSKFEYIRDIEDLNA